MESLINGMLAKYPKELHPALMRDFLQIAVEASQAMSEAIIRAGEAASRHREN